MIVKRTNGNMIDFNLLEMNMFFNDLFDECRSIEEIKYVGKCIIKSLDLSLEDTLLDNGFNTLNDEITSEDLI